MPGAVHIDAWSGQIRLDAAQAGVAPAGVDINAAASVVEGSGCDSLGGVSRIRHHRVGRRAQKKGVVRDKAFRRQPKVILAPQIEGVVDPDPPDARGGLYKAHDNELASGAGLRHLIVQINHCIFQDKGNALLGEGIVGMRLICSPVGERKPMENSSGSWDHSSRVKPVSPSATRSSASSNSSSVPMVPKKWWLYPVHCQRPSL